MSKCAYCDRQNLADAEKCSGCGASLRATIGPSSSQFNDGAQGSAGELADQLAPLIAAGQMIEAIKQYREVTGASLAEAKQAIEQLCDRGQLAAVPVQEFPLDASQEQAIVEMLRSGKAIEAIRYYRQQRVTDLKTAKEAIEVIARQNGITLNLPGPGSAILVVALIAVGAVALGGVIYWLNA